MWISSSCKFFNGLNLPKENGERKVMGSNVSMDVCIQEDVFSCYTVVQELDKGKSRPATDVHESSSVTSAASTKRKRLTSYDFDPNYEIPNEKRPRQGKTPPR